MPNNTDFSTISDVKTISITPQGWITPLYIEYGIQYYLGVPSYYWRVKGTLHTFIISITRIDFISQGKYNEHFTEILEDFREDYKSWAEENFKYKWQQEYRDQYSAFISL